jgi:hypothetical protein
MKEQVPKSLEKCRITSGAWGSDESYGMTGAFELNVSAGQRRTFGRKLRVISNCPRDNNQKFQDLDETKFEHVSVSLVTEEGTPTWEEMDAVKRLFFRDGECVMQLHVPEGAHINTHEGCLHLWRPLEEKIPRPPQALV